LRKINVPAPFAHCGKLDVAPRIHGELLKLGFDVAESTVSKYMVKHLGPPSQTWQTFGTDGRQHRPIRRIDELRFNARPTGPFTREITFQRWRSIHPRKPQLERVAYGTPGSFGSANR